jgi:hypothetical protein
VTFTLTGEMRAAIADRYRVAMSKFDIMSGR